MCKNSKCQGPLLCQNLSNMNYLPTCTSRLVVQHPCQVSFKSMQECSRSWEDKLWWDGRMEGRNDGRMDKANTKCPLAILWRGIKMVAGLVSSTQQFKLVHTSFNPIWFMVYKYYNKLQETKSHRVQRLMLSKGANRWIFDDISWFPKFFWQMTIARSEDINKDDTFILNF